MRILITSDWHLGLKQYGFPQRLRDFADVLPQIAKIAVDHKVDLVVNCGDTFESPEPDPYSTKCYRDFTHELCLNRIPYLALVGNHDLHETSAFTGAHWVDSASVDTAQLSGSMTPSQIADLLQEKYPDRKYPRIAAANWMPGDEVKPWLDAIEPVDLLFMHQSCSAFLPKISHSELELEWLAGKAKVVGIGDTHVNHILELEGTTIISPGPTELNKADEALEKYVVLVDMGKKGTKTKITNVPLKTRKALVFSVASEHELAGIRPTILAAIDQDPLVLISYDRTIARQAQNFRADLTKQGITMLRMTSVSSVSFDQSLGASREEASADMNEILAEDLKGTGLEQVAQDLWRNPENLSAILQSLEGRLRDEQQASRNLVPNS